MTHISDAITMTFAGIAYGQPEKIPAYMAEAEPVAHWSVAWMPEVDGVPDNFMFLAHDGGDQYVVAIRGTYPNPFSPVYWDNANQDSPFGEMAAWSGDSTGAKISKGTNEGLGNLMALKDASGRTVIDAVKALPESATVTVTGHSLGGTQTPVIALKLAEADVAASLAATSFAGMTPGNHAFARLVTYHPKLKGNLRRVYNTLDSVSYGWDNVCATRNFFNPAPKGGILVKLGLLITSLKLRFGGYGFTAIGTDVPLTGSVQALNVKNDLVAFVIETLHQHMPDTYLDLLGAPDLPFSIIWGAITLPKDHPSLNARPNTGLPVVYA
ncbi:MAG: lipase [Pseudomonadota bacterium]